MASPRVSVIVPNYNHARYLRERLDSILAQTFTNFELIYLDDASTDESDDVLDAYRGEPRLAQVVKNPVNSGSPFAQWNRGVALARGEYVWIAESDDRADPRFLERLVPLLDAHPNVGVAYCQSDLIDTYGRCVGSAYEFNRNLGDDVAVWAEDFVRDGRDMVARFFARQCVIPNASAALFRRNLYQEVGGADETLRLMGDYLIWVQLLLASDVTFVAEPLNQFRRHDRTVRNQTSRDGTMLKEAYLIQTILRERVAIAPRVAEAACDDLMDRWIELTLLAPGRLPPARLRSLYHWQKRVDPDPARRYLRRLTARTAQKVARLFGGRNRGPAIGRNGG